MGLIRKAVVVLLGVGIVGAGAIYTGIMPLDGFVPEANVEDIGDWGEVNNNKIEIIHTVNVYNPNPITAELGDAFSLAVDLEMNDVRLGSIKKNRLSIEEGRNSVPVRTELRQNNFGLFWSRFINQDETINAEVSSEVEVDQASGISVSTPPAEVTALSNEQPISDALNGAASGLEGQYGGAVRSDDMGNRFTSGTRFEDVGSDPAEIEYTVENAEVSWGEVNPEKTEMLIELEITNSGDVPIPAVPDGVSTGLKLNNLQVFNAQSESISVRNIDRDSILRSGETQSYTIVTTADNENIEEWFTTYAEQREQSSVRAELQFVFELGDAKITAPQDGAVAYECGFQTDVFVDDQSQYTTCGNDGTIETGPVEFEQNRIEESIDDIGNVGDNTDGITDNAKNPFQDASDDPWENIGDSRDDSSDENNDEGQNEPSNTPPTADATATPQTGEAPLDVTFSASGSLDPDGSIERYIWQIEGPTPGGQGQTIEKTFRTQGEYEATLITVDDDGDRDRDTVTVTVERRSVT